MRFLPRRSRSRLSLGLGSLAALALTGCAPATARSAPRHPSASPPLGAAPLVFDGATVVDVERGSLVPDQRVVITGNRIKAVGRTGAVKIPAGAQVVDARGKYLIPGLWDMHVHGAMFRESAERTTEVYYPSFLANGVTGIRDAGSPVPLDTLRRWRREILAGTRVGPPRQLLSGSSIHGPSVECDRRQLQLKGHLETCVTDSADAVHYVDSLKAAGADMIKPRDVPRELYYIIAAAAKRAGLPFGGHAIGAIRLFPDDPPGQWVTALEASDSGARLIDHIDADPIDVRCLVGSYHWTHFDKSKQSVVFPGSIEQCEPVAKRLRVNGTWVVLTFSAHAGNYRGRAVSEQAITDSVGSLITHWLRKPDSTSLFSGNWLRRSVNATTSGADSVRSLQIAQRTGLPLVAGTDQRTGFWLHNELAVYVREGLTPLDALQAATLNPAKMLHATDSLGTVAAGKLADLVLLDADPLADITNTTTIRAVVANGRYYDRAALDSVLAEARAKARHGFAIIGNAVVGKWE